jgi:hypothetical protein
MFQWSLIRSYPSILPDTLYAVHRPRFSKLHCFGNRFSLLEATRQLNKPTPLAQSPTLTKNGLHIISQPILNRSVNIMCTCSAFGPVYRKLTIFMLFPFISEFCTHLYYTVVMQWGWCMVGKRVIFPIQHETDYILRHNEQQLMSLQICQHIVEIGNFNANTLNENGSEFIKWITFLTWKWLGCQLPDEIIHTS